jgi:hypothetical protein
VVTTEGIASPDTNRAIAHPWAALAPCFSCSAPVCYFGSRYPVTSAITLAGMPRHAIVVARRQKR